jgi:hypothetical protein
MHALLSIYIIHVMGGNIYIYLQGVCKFLAPMCTDTESCEPVLAKKTYYTTVSL